MKPLTPFKYFFENKKKGMAIFLVMLLSVTVVSFITSLVTSIFTDSSKSQLDYLTNVSIITPLSDEIEVKDSTIKQVNSSNNIGDRFEVSVRYTHFNSILGNIGSPVFIPLSPSKIPDIMNKMDLKLCGGRLPGETDNEIVMNERLLTSKGLNIGDYIGSSVDKNEQLAGKYKIVGEMKGNSVVSFANTDVSLLTLKSSGLEIDKPIGLMLFPKADDLLKMNSDIDKISKTEATIYTYDKMKASFENQLASLNTILFIIIFAIVFIVAISISAITYILYLNRSDEFGILYALGFRKAFIKRLIFKEIVFLSSISWLFGYLFSWLISLLVNHLILEPKGEALYFFTKDGLINTLIIPIMVIVFATVPVLRRLKKWDPISVIERKN